MVSEEGEGVKGVGPAILLALAIIGCGFVHWNVLLDEAGDHDD